jgi:hypothetical protein
MATFFLVYVLIGAALGCLWNRAEFGRSSWRRTAPSYAASLLAWPGLVAVAIAVAAIWTRLWRRAHAADAKVVETRAPVAAPLAISELSHPV